MKALNTVDIKQRARELNEWWLLRRRDPAALHRARLRSDVDDYNLADGYYTPVNTPELPMPRGPQPIEIAGVAGAFLLLFIVVAIIGAIAGPPPSNQTRQAAALPTIETSLATTSTTPTTKPDLPAVPLGQSQTIEGTAKNTGDYKAKVTVTAVTRTGDRDIHISARIDVLQGILPLSRAWSLVTKSGQTIDLGGYGDDDEFGTEVTGTVEGIASGYADDDAALSYVRLQPRYALFGDETNQAATWTIGAVTTSLTETPTPSNPAGGTGGGGGTGDTDLPNVDLPNVDLPHLGDCVNHHRKSNGHFC